MIKRIFIHLSIVTCMAIITGCAPSTTVQGEKWIYIGTTDLYFDMSTGELPTRGYDDYREFKFLVLSSAVTFLDLQVKFEDGTSENISAQNTVTPGSHSRSFRVMSKDKRIRSISFTYKKVNEQSRHSRIRLYALRVEK